MAFQTATAEFDGTQDYVDIVWPVQFARFKLFATPYGPGLIPPVALENATPEGVRVTPTVRFTGRVDVEIIELNELADPPVVLELDPDSGSPGATVTISGYFLLGATRVRFGLFDADFTVVDDQTITAEVPAGAVTAAVTVETPAGIATGPIFTVIPVTLLSITVDPSFASIDVGDDQQLTATGHYSDSSTADITNAVDWSSSAEGVATVDDFGLVSGVANGGATITATLGEISGDAVVEVGADELWTFRRTIVQPDDGSDFMVELPNPQASDVYAVRPTLVKGSSAVFFECPDVAPTDRTTTEFRVRTSTPLANGDVVEFILTQPEA